jgi:hypothetical protein
MFAAHDKYFDSLTVDPVLRRKGIRSMTFRRNFLFGCAIAATLCAFSSFFAPSHNSVVPASLGFTAALQWMVVFSVQSDLRLLRAIDRLQGGRDGRLAG